MIANNQYSTSWKVTGKEPDSKMWLTPIPVALIFQSFSMAYWTGTTVVFYTLEMGNITIP